MKKIIVSLTKTVLSVFMLVSGSLAYHVTAEEEKANVTIHFRDTFGNETVLEEMEYEIGSEVVLNAEDISSLIPEEYRPDLHSFSYWNVETGPDSITDPSFENTIEFDALESQIEVMVFYDVQKMTVRFASNGGYGEMNDQPIYWWIVDPKSSILNDNQFLNDGYSFVGWNTQADGTGLSFDDKAQLQEDFVAGKDLVVLYAQWQKTEDETIDCKISDDLIHVAEETLIDEDLTVNETNGVNDLDNVTIYESEEEAASVLRQALVSRETSEVIYVRYDVGEGENPSSKAVELKNRIQSAAYSHTSVPWEGSFLSNCIDSLNGYYDFYQDENGYYAKLDYRVSYLLTQEQDLELNQAIDDLMDALDLSGKSEYEKAKAIYNYVTANIVYDTEHDNTYKLKDTAYAALIDKSATYKGIHALVYRLLLTAGIDNVTVSATLSTGSHPYVRGTCYLNLVRIDDQYYFLDAAYDLGVSENEYNCFLLSYYSLSSRGILLGSTYQNEEFRSAYPFSPKDYENPSIVLSVDTPADLEIEAGSSVSLVFVPNKSGKYTFQTIDSQGYVLLRIEGSCTRLSSERIGNDITNVYRLSKDIRYVLTISFKDAAQSGTVRALMSKNAYVDAAVTDISIDPLIYYEGIPTSINGSSPNTYNYYDTVPRNLTVTMSNGDVISGSVADVEKQLKDLYELDFGHSLLADTQAYGSEWSKGTYDCVLNYNGVSYNYQIIVESNPFVRVEIDDLSIYNNEYASITEDETGSSVYQFDLKPERIVLIGSEKTYQGSVDDVCAEVSADFGYSFSFPTSVMTSFGEIELLGEHAIPIQLFGIETQMNVLIKENPVVGIKARGRTYDESEKKTVTSYVENDSGEMQEISYLAFPYEPYSITLSLLDGSSFTGTAEEVTSFLASEYNFIEEFRYEGMDSYDKQWRTGGTYTITLRLRKLKTTYSVKTLQSKSFYAVDDALYETASGAIPSVYQAIINGCQTATVSWKQSVLHDEDWETAAREAAKQLYTDVLHHSNNLGDYYVMLDYLRLNFEPTISIECTEDDGFYESRCTYRFSYAYTPEQYQSFVAKFHEVIGSLDLDGKSEHEKVLAVYGYITSHVTYDYSFRPISQTAYSALMDERSVCAGISELCRAMLSYVGVNVYAVGGYGEVPFDGEPHEWNIVQIDGSYYNLDATWDLGNDPSFYKWFLQCDHTFERDGNFHKRNFAFDENNPEVVVSLLDYGDDAVYVETDTLYELAFDENDTITLVYEPKAVGRYTLSIEGFSGDISIDVDGDSVIPKESSASMTDDEVFYKCFLETGKRYRFNISSKDTTDAGTIKVSITKNQVEPVDIVDVSVKPEKNWVEGLGESRHKKQNGNVSYYYYYNVEPSFMSVTMEDGNILEGSYAEVIERLAFLYEKDIDVVFEGDSQNINVHWSTGSTHSITMHFDDFILNYQINIVKDPIVSISMEDLSSVYDTDYNLRTGSGSSRMYHYGFKPGVVTVVTADKTYYGNYDDVYLQICRDYCGYSYVEEKIESFYEAEVAGEHEIIFELFGKETTAKVMILYDPVSRITAEDRTVNTDGRYVIEEKILNEDGTEQLVSYEIYPYLPQSLTLVTRDGNTFTGTVEEVDAYLEENYGYSEEFVFSGQETYDERWNMGCHPMKVKLRKASATYNVAVVPAETAELQLDTPLQIDISSENQSVFLSFDPGECRDNSIFVLVPDSDADTIAYLYDKDMNLVTYNDGVFGEESFNLSYVLLPNSTYYYEIRYKDGRTGSFNVNLRYAFVSNTFNNPGTIVYENQGVYREEIIDGETIRYIWYDYEPLSARVSLNGKIRTDSLSKIKKTIYDETGVYYDYKITTDQSYDNQWAVGGSNYTATLRIYDRTYNLSGISVRPGPILSIDVDDLNYGKGLGKKEYYEDENGNQRFYESFDVEPRHIVAHTVDGDIEGTPEEILQSIEKKYKISLDAVMSGNDQSKDNEWDAGIHTLHYQIGNVSASYKVLITESFKSYLNLRNKESADFHIYSEGNELPALIDDDGTYYLAKQGETISCRMRIKDHYEAADNFAVMVNNEAADLTYEGDDICFSYVLDEQTSIDIVGVYYSESSYEAINVASSTLTLNGEIGVNFYLTIPLETLPHTYVSFLFKERTVTYKASDAFKDEKLGYRFTVKTVAKEMREPILLTVRDESGAAIQLLSATGKYDYTAGYPYSVERYFKLAEKQSSNQKLLNLVENMNTYGKYSQDYLSYKNENLVLEDVSDITIDDVEQYASKRSGQVPEGLTYAGSSLILDSMTSIRHNYKLNDGYDIQNYSFTIDGMSVTPKLNERGEYYVSIDNIAAKDLDKFSLMSVTDGINTAAINYCGLSYARASIRTGNRSQNLCRALYKYYLAAEEYFSN